MIISNKPRLTKHILYTRKLRYQQLIPVFDFKMNKIKRLFCIKKPNLNQSHFKPEIIKDEFTKPNLILKNVQFFLEKVFLVYIFFQFIFYY